MPPAPAGPPAAGPATTMGLLARRSRPPKEPSARERLQSFVLRCRVPDGVTLEALTDGLTAEACLDAGRCYPPDKILEDAFSVYVKASETLRRSREAERRAVRGCTAELLALVIAQALELAAHVDQQGKQRAVHAQALEAVQQKLRVNFARALTLREQARRVLAAMGRDDAGHLDEVLRAASATDERGSVAAAMVALGAIGRRLLGDASPKTVQKARLLGLDEQYVSTIETMGVDLKRAQDELARLAQQAHTPDDQLFREAGLTVHLMMHVIEAFESAHEVDASVPLLRPVHTQRMVRKMSRIPPPLPPMAVRADAKLGQVKVPDIKITDVRSPAPGANFRGGLGRAKR